MKFKTAKKRNNGFTLVEMLAVTAIVVILLAVGMVAVVHYARWLRITELDNSAREIYLAAENRAVLLSAGGRLEAQVKAAAADGAEQTVTPLDKSKGTTPLAAGGTGAAKAKYRYIYYNGDANQLEDLLPVGTIDPALRDGCFYIVYEVSMGSVTDVFYAEDGELLKNDDFQAFYGEWRGSSRDHRLNNKKMIGYYGGEAAGNDKTDALKAPTLIVHNEEELWVELSYKVPAGETQETRKPVVKLYHVNNGSDRQYEIDLSNLGKWTRKTSTTDINGTKTYTYTLVLDSLEAGKQFKDLYTGGGAPASFGWDFTVEAWIEGGTVRSTSATDTGNSLFASRKEEKDGDGTTAYIGNLRHLQNLDKEHSKVGGKTAAVQTADIEQSTSKLEYYQDYEFKPIVNDELKSYCGSYGANGADSVTHFIKGLTVTATSANGRNGGLFSTVQGAESALWTFKDVRLINTSIGASDGLKLSSAGALVGQATDASFTNCWAYWEGEELEELKASITGTKLADDNYQINGTNAGGLVGELNGGTITGCLAATLVKGTNIAGGLVGQTTGAVTVQNSYADCYLTAGTTIGGLIGNADATGGTELTNVYSAGFIYNDSEEGEEKYSAGLCNGTATASHAYSAMHYEKTGGNIVPLADNVTGGTCYYLKYSGSPPGVPEGKSFEDMIEPEFITLMNTESTPGAFAEKKSAYDPSAKENEKSHPYNLLDGVPLTVYPFPGLADLPHYGDWPSEIVSTTLVYYEQYKVGNSYEYRFQGVDALRDDAVVSLDGYAVMLTDLNSDDVTIKFTYLTQDGKKDTTLKYTRGTDTGDAIQLLEKVEDGKTYYFAPLPKELIDSAYASRDFYQPIGIEVDSSTTWCAYNPHFAKAAEPIPEGIGETERPDYIANMGKQARGYVRTPRHLRALSRFEEYYHPAVGRGYSFLQELDLDYETYEGYDWKTSWEDNKYTQEPIGKFGAAFNGNYDGECHTIKNVKFALPEDSSRQYAGLFGLSAGNLQNIVYLMNPKETISVSRDVVTLHLGALAGGNSGTITNCAVAGVNLAGTVYTAKDEGYVGGLVGLNNGAIINCAAEVASLKARGEHYSTVYAGGLVGRNNRTISTSYAVGYISGTAQDDSTVRVCGFVGYNTGEIKNSYTAARLESSGAGVETFGFCGEKAGSQRNTYFVDKGNFTYREEPYNGTYSIGYERADTISYQSIKFEETDPPKEKPKVVSEGGMAWGGTAVWGNEATLLADQFPLPTGVTKNGQPVHYGQWPVELDLGLMGIYYWEKMELPAASGNSGIREIYGVSLLKVDPTAETVEKISTLSNARSDGGVVTDYGYGWYCEPQEEGNTVKTEFKAAGLSHTRDGGQDDQWKDQPSDKTVDEKLAGLMPGYTFHSYHSFVPNPDPNGTENPADGLYATGAKDSAPNGTVTLKKENVEATFEVNPHFADALSISKAPDNYTVSDNNLKISPGTNEGNPYEVRAMGQLSAINWNSTSRDTKTVMWGQVTDNDPRYCMNFSYLSTSDTTGKYHWRQTHDLDGNGQTQTPIAEYYDSTNGEWGTLSGWFGGTYEGDDYVIENINIQGQASSCVGLFGMVFQGKLSNIVMYSSDGNGVISTIANGGADGKGAKTQSRWYAMGALAGMVGGSTIENCSAAGYEIDATVFTYSIGQDGWGGNNIGGLIGATDGGLSGCASVTEISVHDATENDNMRVGGLVGVCQGTISNCYAGGSISFGGNVTVQRDNRFIYVGGLVGGSYMKPLKVADNVYVGIDPTNDDAKAKTSNELIDCYSYVTLPKRDAAGTKTNEMHNILALYALGGTGEINENGDWDKKFSYSNNGIEAENHGTCTITNCYYLESEVMKNNPGKLVGVAKTDLFDLTRNAVQVIVTDEKGNIVRNGANNHFIEEKILLTANDVGKEFLISYNGVNTGYTYDNVFHIKIDNQIVDCPYYHHGIDSSHYASGVPIFKILNKATPNNTSDCKWVVFRGWAVDLAVESEENVQVTNDPTMFDDLDNSVTYDQLAGRKLITKDGVSKLIMTADGTDSWLAGFRPVTATEGSFDIPGKYSYSSKARPELQGRDYPFPTILTRENGTIHVHYGDWPLNGIERTNGGAPIRLDLLKDDGESETETLKLSEGVPQGGTWTLTVNTAEGEEPIIEAYLGSTEGSDTAADNNRSCQLTVKGLKTGQTSVTVTYIDLVGVTYEPMPITVNVTATLRVKSELSPIYVFPGAENVKVPLVLCDDKWNKLSPEKLAKVEIDLDESVCRSPEELLSSATLGGNKENGYYLFLNALTVEEPEKLGEQALTVSVAYSYDGAKIEPEHSMLSVEMKPLPKPETEDGITRITLPKVEETGVVTKVMVDGTEISQTEPTEPTDPTNPDGSEPEATWVGDVVSLKNYNPGTKVTLTLSLELKRSDAEVDEQPITQTVPMTVTIPERETDEGTNSEAEQAENQETVQAAEPEQTPEAKPAAGEAAELPEGPDPALPVEGKTDPVPEKDAGAGEDETEPKQ